MAKLKNIKITTLFVSFSLFFGLIAAIIMPVASVPDETYHFNISFNEFLSNKEMEKNVANTPSKQRLLGAEDLFAIRDTSVAGSADDLFKLSFTRKVEVLEQSHFRIKFNKESLLHLPQALGVLLGYLIYPSYGLMFFLGRVFNLLFYIGLIYIAIKKAAFGKLPISVIAHFPITIQQAASLSYDTTLFVTVFLVFSLMTRIWSGQHKISWKWVIYFPLILLVLYLTKKSALILLSLLLTLPTTFFNNKKIQTLSHRFWNFWNKHKWLVLLVLVLGSSVVFRFLFQSHGGFMRWAHIMFNTYFATWINGNLDPIIVSGMVGAFSAFSYRLPEWLIILTFVILSWLMLSDKKVKIDNRVVFISSCIFIYNILLTGTMMYLGWTGGKGNVSIGEQGRYYTPFLIYLLPLFMKISEKVKVEITGTHRKLMAFGLCFVNLSLFIILTIIFWFSKG
ncbi:DUF2142 domain-containing protein [Lactococcus lactis]|uniref:DUF2142 domain-containing protein n=1 Tax=Lactococcus lactis TaxID=1358 RepID=UPI0004E1C6DE|nr:DUF2142 domain-containing protein [Lactococcus lactis]OJH48202.1 hypothetical protein LGL2_00895 [Lactococcus lactis subsp. lactis bv. diacetylactis]